MLNEKLLDCKGMDMLPRHLAHIESSHTCMTKTIGRVCLVNRSLKDVQEDLEKQRRVENEYHDEIQILKARNKVHTDNT